MNLKQAKRIRKMFKNANIDVTQAEYVEGKPSVRYITTTDQNGLDKLQEVLITGTIFLEKSCGKAQYKQYKKGNK
jgi:hypothetical protein